MEKKKNALNGSESWLREHSVSINKLMLLYCPHKQQKRYYKISTQKTPIQKYVYFTLTGGQMS